MSEDSACPVCGSSNPEPGHWISIVDGKPVCSTPAERQAKGEQR